MIKYTISNELMKTCAGEPIPVHTYVLSNHSQHYGTAARVQTTGMVGGNGSITDITLSFKDLMTGEHGDLSGFNIKYTDFHNETHEANFVDQITFGVYGDWELQELATMLEFAARVLRNQIDDSYDDNDGVAPWLKQSGQHMIVPNWSNARYYTCTDCYNDYRQYCEVMKYTPVTFRQFGIRLSERHGIISQSRKGHRVYIKEN